jgi:TatD DNase family protein
MLVDSHCHLEYDSLSADADGVMARAKAAGVEYCVTIGTKLATFPKTLAVAERCANVWCSIGVHPHDAAAEPLEGADALIAHTEHPKVVAIGEAGLDYFYDHSPRAEQIANFRIQIDAARRTGLPLVIHTRDAEDDTISILSEEMAKGRFTGVLHCFSGTKRLAQAGLELGLFVSASGIITFKKSEALRDVFREVPLDRLLVETDAPYLAPVPHRGKPNEPAFVAHTAAALAALRGVAPGEIGRITSDNFFRLFTKAHA